MEYSQLVLVPGDNNRYRVVPPNTDREGVWPGDPNEQHVAYPKPGEKCRCGHC